MKNIQKLISLALFLVLGSCVAAEKKCHLLGDDNGRIYKTCDHEEREIKFDYDTFFVRLDSDDTNKNIAIMVENPLKSELRDERYFIFDYKNMIIYGNKCLNGNFVMSDNKNQILFSKYGEDKLNLFNPIDFNNCKLPLSEWVKSDAK